MAWEKRVPVGPKGETGLTAYQIAVNGGFVGTEAEWLLSLEGAKGEPGIDGTGSGTVSSVNDIEPDANGNVALPLPPEPDLTDYAKKEELSTPQQREEWNLTLEKANTYTDAAISSLPQNEPIIHEKGIWTPHLKGVGGGNDISYASRSGTYTRIGDMIFANFSIQVSNKGTSSGNMQLSGFPFAILDVVSSSVFNINKFTFGQGATGVLELKNAGGLTVYIRQLLESGSFGYIQITDNSFTIEASIIYKL